MTKFMNKYVRKFHRWLSLPFVALILLVLFTHNLSFNSSILRIQQITMIIMVISGLYLFLLPCRARWSKSKNRKLGSTK